MDPFRTAIQRREYQHRTVERTEGLLALKTGAVLVVQPTGTGKTVTAVMLIQNREPEKDGRVTFLAPRREIVHQTADKVADFSMSPGIIMAGHKYQPRKGIQVASVDTMRSWVKREKIKLDPGTTLLVDEAHRSMSKTHQWLIEAAKDGGADVIGLTATPVRTDGVGLFPTYQHMVMELEMVQAIKEGWLVQPDYRIAFVPDLAGVKIKGGDFSEIDLERIMNQKVLVGDIVDNWLKHARGMRTLAFASSVAHSISIQQEFERVGARFVHIDGTTSGRTRDNAIKALHRGEIDGIVNCAVFTEGTDIPSLQCIVDAGPTKSQGRHVQKWGRGTRPIYADGFDIDTVNGRLAAIAASNKPKFLLLDHAGNFYRGGRIDRNIPWQLEAGKEWEAKDREKREKAAVQFTCADCGKVFSRQVYCPNCGLKIVKTGKMKDYLDAELVSLTQAQFEKIEETITWRDRRNFYLEALHWCRAPHKTKRDETGRPAPNRKDGFAAHLFKQKFGEWPDDEWHRMKPIPPTTETLSYIRSRNIAWAKGKKSGQGDQH